MRIKQIHPPESSRTETGYIIPFHHPAIEITQGYNGPYSHIALERGRFRLVTDDRYCLDFKLPFGTPVVASKSGIVELIVNEFDEFYEGVDLDAGLRTRANFIVLLHSEGTRTIYSHLGLGTPRYRRGDAVEQGQVIAQTGKSGWIGPDPHLHFSAFELNNSIGRRSFPVIFDDYLGLLEDSELESINRAV